MASTSFSAIDPPIEHPGTQVHTDTENPPSLPDPSAFILPCFDESFVGLTVCPGYALVDTGAQHGVAGKKSFDKRSGALSVFGLRPRRVPTLQLDAAGIGGTTAFIFSAEVPVSLGGVSGVLTLHAIDQNIPVLLPISFCKKLGMVLDIPEQQVHWNNIKKSSDTHELPEGHIVVDILGFNKTGWKNPPCL